jgi:hypothetical protein
MRLLVSANLLFTALICSTALAALPLPAEKELARSTSLIQISRPI